MRMKSIGLTCPKCKRKPQYLKSENGLILKCKCYSTASYTKLVLALRDWLIWLDKNDNFKLYDKIIIG